MGYFLAIISSFFFAVYNVPKKLSKQKTMYYILFMGLGNLIFSIIFYIGNLIINSNNNETLLNWILLLSFLRGVLWWIATNLLLAAINLMGLGKASQWKALQSPIGTLLMLIVFNEAAVMKTTYILIAIVLMTVSAYLITISDNDNKKSKKGIIYVLLSAIFLSINAIIQKYVTGSGLIYSQMIYMSVGITLSSIIYILVKDKNLKIIREYKDKNNYLGIIGGALYFFANYTSTVAYQYLLGTIVYVIIQINSIWTLLISVFIFKEIEFKRNALRIIIAIISMIIAVLLLLVAKT